MIKGRFTLPGESGMEKEMCSSDLKGYEALPV